MASILQRNGLAVPAATPIVSSAKGLTVIVPTLNEAANVEPLLDRIFGGRNAELVTEALFVDDGSTDSTCDRISELAARYPVRVIRRNTTSGGLAGAVLEGAAAARTRWVLVMDADLSHPPEKITDLMAPLLDGSQDMVIGSRYITGGQTPGWPVWRRAMSRSACLLAAPLTRVKDPLSGFFATRRSSILNCKGNPTGFKIALEIIVRAGNRFRVKEIPVVFKDRVRGQSKMNLRVLFIYLMRLSYLLLWQTGDDFRVFAGLLIGRFRWQPNEQSTGATVPAGKSLVADQP